MSASDEQATLFARSPSQRERFLAGLLATWAAIDRGGPAAKPTVEEKRRAAAGARAALGEILR